MLKRLKLRDKMTLWYSALMLLVLSAFALAVYFMTDYVLEEMLERETRLSMEQVIAQIENEDGLRIFEEEVPLAAGSMYFITEENGSELASYGSDITLFDHVPVSPGRFRFVQGDSERWLLLDSDLIEVAPFTLRVRVASSCALGDRVLAALRVIFLVGVPLAMAAAVWGGRLIATRSLRPITHIVRSAERISQGDLSTRIPPAPARDELGEMTDTLNAMIASVEKAFQREQRFTSDASHELRTPVAVIHAYAETLRASAQDGTEQAASLQTILDECARMQKIINQLLAITRGQEGRFPMQKEELCLREVCSGVADSFADALHKRGMTLTVSAPEELTLTADQSLMAQMLLNLVENAVKYGKDGGHIEIAAWEENGRVMLRVSDDGAGIPAEALPLVFERFYRVDAARDRSGTGLGLSIVDWIVKAHGGTISVTSELGEGTAFTVELPKG